MSDLGMHLGDVEATKHLRVGDAWSRGLSGVADAITGTVNGLAQYADQEPARTARTAQLRADASKADRETAFNGAMDELKGLGADEVIEGLRQRGFHEKAADLQSKLDKSRDDALDRTIKEYSVAEKRLGEAASLLDSVRAVPGGESAAYTSVLPKVRELVGPDLGKAIPEQYDPSFIDQATTWGMSMKDKLALRKDAAAALLSKNRDTRDADTHFTQSLSKWLGTVDSQDDWNDAIAAAANLGAPPQTLAKFGKEFSPEAVERARSFTARDESAPRAGSFESFMTSFAADKGVPVTSLSPSDQLRARRQWESAGWKPEKPSGPDGELSKLTPADYQSMRAQIEQVYEQQAAPIEGSDREWSMEARNSAIRWKEGQIAALDKAARKSGLDPLALAKGRSRSMADLGGENPPGWHAPMAPGVSPRPPAGVAPSSPAPVRAPQARPAPEVESVLKAAGPGEYDLRDGSTWRVYPDGRMEKVK